MPPISVWPAVAAILGAWCGALDLTLPHGRLVLVALFAAALMSSRLHRPGGVLLTVTAGFAVAGALLAADARWRALHSELRERLNASYPGFRLTAASVDVPPPPVPTRFALIEDAAALGDVVALQARITGVRVDERWHDVPGEAVRLTVGGAEAFARMGDWRAGRRFTAPVSFRRPARFLNDGVEDFEQTAALDGTVLLGSIKSALLVEVAAPGSWPAEAAANVRRHVRRRIAAYVTPHDPTAGAIVTAVLIGDRTGLPDEVRTRLQKAGTYHVIAISGGNIAILAALLVGLLFICGIRGRRAAAVTILMLAAYALVVTSGPSVWRATLMAMLYFSARLLDHRTSPWQAMAVAAVVLVLLHPLDIGNPGFILTFGATAALLESARRASRSVESRQSQLATAGVWRQAIAYGRAWVVASLLASLAVEVTLAPVSAQMFSRVTAAGVVLNLVSVPLMAVVQAAGLALVCVPGWEAAARLTGWVACVAAEGLIESARLVDLVPALSRRVPPPGMVVLGVYYGGVVTALAARHVVPWPVVRWAGAAIAAGAAVAVACGWPVQGARTAAVAASELRLTMLDVGQAESLLLEAPHAAPLLVDAGGVPFGGAGVDIGGRVIAPALWARGIRSLGALLVTHGDPDHLGGASVLVDDFSPRRLWTGVLVPSHLPMRIVAGQARAAGARLEGLYAGDARVWGKARIRILHPPAPDWERQRVRNDDSVVLDVTFGGVSILLTGDISAEVERALIPRLSDAAVRILKVAHHGSRTSSSGALLEAWRPAIALISCGRGNAFGHPAPEVLRRLEAIGSRVYRTDRDGQVTLDTDGVSVRVKTWRK